MARRTAPAATGVTRADSLSRVQAGPREREGKTGTARRSRIADDMAAVSRAMVSFHKEQFGRGPTRARSHMGGRNALSCVMEDALLPYEQKMVELGDAARVRESRIAFQVATKDEFIAAVERILCRKVRAFASTVDPDKGVVFENFTFEPVRSEELGGDAGNARSDARQAS